jgi:SAM-dependent methyltransferase
VNRIHRWLCRSDFWKTEVETRLLPWAIEGVNLGARVLEIGPGPGLTTDILRRRAGHLTCVEIDPALAQALAQRMAGQHVTVLEGDATAMPSLLSSTFDSVVSLTMLHHVRTAALQDRLLAEVARVLRPGGLFVGTDSLASPFLRLFHLFDTFVPIDPRDLPARLSAAAFTGIQVQTTAHTFRFRATRRHR